MTIISCFTLLICVLVYPLKRVYCRMKVKKLDLLLIILCFIIGCGLYNKEALEHFVHSQQNAEIKSAPNVGISKIGQLYYVGPINYKGYELLQNLYKNSKNKITNRTLIIESGGGDAFAGLKIGNFIKDKKLSVKVPSLCLSACAFYIFPAANFKYLGKNALIGFHEPVLMGTTLTFENILTNFKVNNILSIDSHDFIQADTSHTPAPCRLHPELVTTPTQNDAMIQNTIKSCFNYINHQTKSFYRQLNVDSRLLEIGIPKLRQVIKSNDQINLFYYDSESLTALGVKKVIYPYDWDPQNNPEYKHMIEIKRSDWL